MQKPRENPMSFSWKKAEYHKVILWHGIAREIKESSSPRRHITKTEPDLKLYEKICSIFYHCISSKSSQRAVIRKLSLRNILQDLFNEKDMNRIHQRTCDLLLMFIDHMKGRMFDRGKYVFIIFIEYNDGCREIILGHTKGSKSLPPPDQGIKFFERFFDEDALLRFIRFLMRNDGNVICEVWEKHKSQSVMEFLGIEEHYAFEEGEIKIRVNIPGIPQDKAFLEVHVTNILYLDTVMEGDIVKFDPNANCIYLKIGEEMLRCDIEKIFIGRRRINSRELVRKYHERKLAYDENKEIMNRILEMACQCSTKILAEEDEKQIIVYIEPEEKRFLKCMIDNVIPIFSGDYEHIEIQPSTRLISAAIDCIFNEIGMDLYHVSLPIQLDPLKLWIFRIRNNIIIPLGYKETLQLLEKVMKNVIDRAFKYGLRAAYIKLLSCALINTPLFFFFNKVYDAYIRKFSQLRFDTIVEKEITKTNVFVDVKRIDILFQKPSEKIIDKLLHKGFSQIPQEPIVIFEKCISPKLPFNLGVIIVGLCEETGELEGMPAMKHEDLRLWEEILETLCNEELRKSTEKYHVTVIPLPHLKKSKEKEKVFWSFFIVVLRVKTGEQSTLMDFFQQ